MRLNSMRINLVLLRQVSFCLVSCIVLASGTCAANEWFVSPGGSDNADGTSQDAPFHTINYAIDRAAENDTIILLPGDYGYETPRAKTVNGNSSNSRIIVSKTLTIKSLNGRDSRDSTRILGAWDTDEIEDTPYGIGPKAVRCAWVSQAAKGTRFEGVTFAQGSVPAWTESNDYTSGGGVFVDPSSGATFVDCAFVDCQAWNGGGILFAQTADESVKAVRCLFKRCRATKFGHAMRGGSAYNCVFDDNGFTCLRDGTQKIVAEAFDAGAFTYGKYAINCTFLNGRTYGIGGCFGANFVGVYNCLFQNNMNSAGYHSEYCPTVVGCVGGGYVYVKPEVYSPYDGDYRLTWDATAIDAGSVGCLSLIPEEFRDTDYCGNARTASGKVHAGAVQDAAAAAASGVAISSYDVNGALYAGRWTLDGEPVSVCCRTWTAREGWPVPRHVGLTAPDGRAIVRFAIGDSVVWPLRDDSAWFAPSGSGIVQHIIAYTTANVFYTDPVNGDDDNDGSKTAPMKTLNKAVKCADGRFVVFARAGDYCNAAEVYGGCTNRVVVPDTLAGDMRVVAVDGPGSTFITGASDATSDGTGGNAVRCIAVACTNGCRAAFQGFTLRNGRTGSNYDVPSQGAAILGKFSPHISYDTGFLLDCVVTNCCGNRGATISTGNAYRCRFVDCNSYNDSGQCVLRYGSIVSSSFVGCGGKSQIFGNTARGYNCTIYESTCDAIYNDSDARGYLYNSVVGGRTTGVDIADMVLADQMSATLYQRVSSSSATDFSTSVREDPLRLVDAAGGDCRLTPDSAGLYLASVANMKSCMDIDGNPFVFDTSSGMYQAGCYSAPVPGSGSTLYVDAVGGSDENDGSSENCAFATLASAMAAADYGDTVVALPGTYDVGTMIPTKGQSCYTDTPTLPARVVVKTGVTLESRDGADATVIKGAADPSSGDGCGDAALRGVFLCAGATLRGFTVMDGHTLHLDYTHIDDMGGGICGPYGAVDGSAAQWRGLAENCIITGCTARTGGGAQYGTYRNCRFADNEVYEAMGCAICRGSAEGCVFKGNGSASDTLSVTCYDSFFVNCTLFDGQAGALYRGLARNEGDAIYLPFLNSVILGNYGTGATTNNYILEGAVNRSPLPPEAPKFESGNITGDASVVDENGLPAAGSAIVDAGDASLCPAEYLAGRDIACVRRILNSKIDIGALEYDWGVPWGRALARRNLAIDDMPSDAALSGGNTLVFGGTNVPVEMTWTTNGSSTFRFTATVTGSGTLTITLNGNVLGEATATDGAKTFMFSSALASNSLKFAYDGAEADGVALSCFVNAPGMWILFR